MRAHRSLPRHIAKLAFERLHVGNPREADHLGDDLIERVLELEKFVVRLLQFSWRWGNARMSFSPAAAQANVNAPVAGSTATEGVGLEISTDGMDSDEERSVVKHNSFLFLQRTLLTDR